MSIVDVVLSAMHACEFGARMRRHVQCVSVSSVSKHDVSPPSHSHPPKKPQFYQSPPPRDSEHVSEAQVLAVRKVHERLLDLTALAVNLDPAVLVLLVRSARLQLIPPRILAGEKRAEREEQDEVANVGRETDAPRDEVARPILHPPELRAENLTERVANEEDAVCRQALEEGGGVSKLRH